MKHLAKLMILFVAAGSASAIGAELEATRALLTAGKPVKIVCFGDSLTGVYYHTGGRRAYADMVGIALQRVYPQAHLTMVNAGVSGNTTRNALQRIEKDVLAQRPNLVTVMFGMNDMTSVTNADFEKNLRKIVEQCKTAGAEVLLCTSNSVIATPGRPPGKLAACMEVIRGLAKSEGLPLADCYRAFEEARAADAWKWRLLLSDEIHPNMDGHKLMARTIAAAIAGREVDLSDVGPPSPAIPRTLRLLKEHKPIRVLAMHPYDRWIEAALKAVDPAAQVEVTPWEVTGKAMPDVEQSARPIRGKKYDLVVVAVPAEAKAVDREAFVRHYAWTLNFALSFGRQEWDCIAFAPSLDKPDLSTAGLENDALARILIRAQDLGTIERSPGNRLEAPILLNEWVKAQAGR